METISKKMVEHLIDSGYKVRLEFIEVEPGSFQVEVRTRGITKILSKGKHKKIEPQLIVQTGVVPFAKKMRQKEIVVKFLESEA